MSKKVKKILVKTQIIPMFTSKFDNRSIHSIIKG